MKPYKRIVLLFWVCPQSYFTLGWIEAICRIQKGRTPDLLDRLLKQDFVLRDKEGFYRLNPKAEFPLTYKDVSEIPPLSARRIGAKASGRFV